MADEKTEPEFEWIPWEVFREEPKRLPIVGPPCPRCVYWYPQRTYQVVSDKTIYQGVELCRRGEMSPDFSCFTLDDGIPF